MNKYLIKFAVCCAILCVAFSGYRTIFPGDTDTVLAQKTEESVHLFRIIKAGKFGFIDNKGNIRIEPKFDQAEDFSEGLALVSLNRKKVFIDQTGEIKIAPKDFEAINGFTNGLARGNVTNRERYNKGYIDKSGKIVIDDQKVGGACEFSEGLACVTSGKWGFIDTSGHYIIKPQYDEVGYFREGLAPFTVWNNSAASRHKHGYLDKSGNIAIKPQFDITQPFSEGLAAVGMKLGDDYQFGFIDKSGTMIIRPQFEWTKSFSEGLVAIKILGKWGFIDKNGGLIIKAKFDKAEDFSEGLAAVAVNGRWGYIDKTGKFIVEPKYNEAQSFHYGLAFVKVGSYDANAINDVIGDIDTNGKWGYINASDVFVWKPTN